MGGRHNDTPNPPALSMLPPEYVETPFLERLCDEVEYIVLRNQFDMRRSIWPGPLMNAASCHLLMELSCLGVHCCDTGSAVATRLLERLKDRINQRLHDSQPGPQITHWIIGVKKNKNPPVSISPLFSAEAWKWCAAVPRLACCHTSSVNTV